MSNKELLKQLGLPEVTDFSVAQEIEQEWDTIQSEVVGKELIIVSFVEVTAFDKPGLVCHTLVDGVEKQVLVNGEVLMKELEKVSSHLPISTTIVKTKNYYQFS